MKHILQVWRDDGVPKDVPLMITEDHLAASLTGPMTTIFAALVAGRQRRFVLRRGRRCSSTTRPSSRRACRTVVWAGLPGRILCRMRRLRHQGIHLSLLCGAHDQSGMGAAPLRRAFHVPICVDIKDNDGNVLVTSYAVHRPDGNWSLMLVNRDETNSHAVRVVFDDSKNKREASFSGPVTLVTFGSEQYVWINDGPNSHADPNNPPLATAIEGEPGTVYTLPKASITVLRGKVGVRKD